MKESLIVYQVDVFSVVYVFNSQTFYGEPVVGIAYVHINRFSIVLNLGYEIDISSKLCLDNNKDKILYNNIGEEVFLNWSGVSPSPQLHHNLYFCSKINRTASEFTKLAASLIIVASQIAGPLQYDFYGKIEIKMIASLLKFKAMKKLNCSPLKPYTKRTGLVVKLVMGSVLFNLCFLNSNPLIEQEIKTQYHEYNKINYLR